MAKEQNIVVARYPRFLRAFGLVFATAGMIAMVSVLRGHGTISINDGPSRPATPADAWLPGIFLAIGLGIVCGRFNRRIDVDGRSTVRTIGWGFWVRETRRSLTECERLEIGPEAPRGGGSGRYMAIPVYLVGRDLREEIAAPSRSIAARTLARRVGTALALPVVDHNDEKNPIHAAEDLGRPAFEVTTIEPADLRRPQGTRICVSEADRGVDITLPAASRFALAWLALGVPIIPFSGLCWFFWRPILANAHSTVATVLLCSPMVVIGMLCVISAFAWWRSGWFGGTIHVDSATGLRAWTRRFAPDEIMAIELLSERFGALGLRIVGRRRETIIADGQNRADLRWLRALILHHLRGGA